MMIIIMMRSVEFAGFVLIAHELNNELPVIVEPVWKNQCIDRMNGTMNENLEQA